MTNNQKSKIREREISLYLAIIYRDIKTDNY
jgi:hypothetical protein